MDLIDLIQDKKFLGQEFLTWIWYQSEVNSGLIDIEGFGTVEVWFEDRISLESGSGNFRQVVTCQGRDLELTEARTALREGKKVNQVRLRIGADGQEWKLTVKAEGLELGGIRAPKTFDPGEEEAESMAGRLLDRVAVLHELTMMLDALYQKFLLIRLGQSWESRELPRLRKWLRSDAG